MVGYYYSYSTTSQIDTLTGGDGADTFELGNWYGNVYYDDGVTTTAGVNDYALITDFSFTQSDVIQLRGASTDYSIGTSPVVSATGTAIYYNAGQTTGELIAVVQGDTFTDFSSGFSFV